MEPFPSPKDPAGQAEHVSALDAPRVLLNVPLGQSTQLAPGVVAVVAMYVPAGHAGQSEDEIAPTMLPTDPAGQTVHISTPEAPWVVLYVPTGHDIHDELDTAPIMVPYVPAAHHVHCRAAPGVAWNVPMGHVVQFSPSAPPNAPTGHGSHTVLFVFG